MYSLYSIMYICGQALEVLDAGMQGWRLYDMHVWGQSWKASGMSDHGLQGGEHWEEAKMATG